MNGDLLFEMNLKWTAGKIVCQIVREERERDWVQNNSLRPCKTKGIIIRILKKHTLKARRLNWICNKNTIFFWSLENKSKRIQSETH